MYSITFMIKYGMSWRTGQDEKLEINNNLYQNYYDNNSSCLRDESDVNKKNSLIRLF